MTELVSLRDAARRGEEFRSHCLILGYPLPSPRLVAANQFRELT